MGRRAHRTLRQLGRSGAPPAAPELGGRGVVPKHYQDQVPLARESDAYRTIKDAALSRLKASDCDAELDALQIVQTGVTV